MNNGAILLARQIYNSDIWTDKPSWWFKVWMYILMRVNHKDNKDLRRGQGFFTFDIIYQQCHLKNDHVKTKTTDNALRWFKKKQMLTTKKTTKGMIVTVLNYELYQSLSTYKNATKNDGKNDTETTQKRQTHDSIYKEECKNDKNDKKIISAQIENLLNSFDQSLLDLINKYIDMVRLSNKTKKISLKRKRTLLLELANSRERANNDSLFKEALDASIKYNAPNIGYINAVIRNKITQCKEK